MKILYTHTEAEALMLPEVRKIIDIVKNLCEEYVIKTKLDLDFYSYSLRNFFRLHLKQDIKDEKLPFKISVFRGSFALLLTHKENKCFIKIGGITGVSSSYELRVPKYAIQTCFVFIGEQDFPIRIQPIVDCRLSIRRKVWNELNDIYEKTIQDYLSGNQKHVSSYSLFGNDFMERNVGLYQGKPVVIDW